MSFYYLWLKLESFMVRFEGFLWSWLVFSKINWKKGSEAGFKHYLNLTDRWDLDFYYSLGLKSGWTGWDCCCSRGYFEFRERGRTCSAFCWNHTCFFFLLAVCSSGTLSRWCRDFGKWMILESIYLFWIFYSKDCFIMAWGFLALWNSHSHCTPNCC